MSMDWNFVAQGIRDIGRRAADTMTKKYEQDLAEQRFLKRYESMLRIKDPYDKQAMERSILKAKELARYGIEQEKGLFNWKKRQEAKWGAVYNDEEFMKMRANPDKQADMLLIDREIDKAQRGGMPDPVIMEKVPLYTKMQINKMVLENQRKTEQHEMVMQKLKMYWDRATSGIQSKDEKMAERRFILEQKIGGLRQGINHETSELHADIADLRGDIWDKAGNVDEAKVAKLMKKKKYRHFKARFDEIEGAKRELENSQKLFLHYFGSKEDKKQVGTDEDELLKAVGIG